MKILLLTFICIYTLLASTFAEDVIKFPSPDGKFAVYMGAQMSNHYDEKTSEWVVDQETKAAAIIEQASHKVVLAIDTPLRPDEDKVVWSPDGKRMTYSHRANKITETKVFFVDEEETFAEVKLPELEEVELKMKPPRRAGRTEIVHLDHDAVVPIRWLKSGALMLSSDVSMTSSTEEEITYSRKFLFTISFSTTGEASVKNVVRGKLKAVVNN